MYISRSLEMIALSIKSFRARTCSVVPQPCLYAACDLGIFVSSLSHIRLRRAIVSIFLKMLSRIIGRRFSGGPLALPGYCIGYRSPWTKALGTTPVAAVSL